MCMDLMKLSIPFVTQACPCHWLVGCTSPSKKAVVDASFQVSMITFTTLHSSSMVKCQMVKRKSRCVGGDLEGYCVQGPDCPAQEDMSFELHEVMD